jgi:hypothetical protein
MRKYFLYKNIKVLSVHDDYFIASEGYNLKYVDIKTNKISHYASINGDLLYSLFSRFYLTRRFFRAEITNLYELSNGTEICIAKKGIFRKEKNETTLKKCFSIKRGSRPMNLCINDEEHIFFGEYFSNKQKQAVNIYTSKDKGLTWSIAYTFTAGNINHIHGLFWDRYTKRIWITTGDRENECIIAYTENSFKTLNIVFRGGQEFRATNLLFYKDFIVFGTDSQYIKNEIKRIDRDTLSISKIKDIQGSAIYGGQCGDFAYISTTVEPSEINKDNNSYLWYTKDGIEWKQLFSDKKDSWNGNLFQFGSILFPQYMSTKILKENIFFYGRALKKIGGHSIKLEL